MKCPGQDTQYWTGDAIFETQCPECGHTMEFFKDDATRRCINCHKKIVNPKMDFGCASYCKFAEQCLGTLPEEFVAQRDDLLKDRVAVEMKRYLGRDFKRIGHAAKVAGFAEKIGKKEKANLAVVLCAAYLAETGVKNAMEKYGSKDPEYIRKESPETARQLMEKLGAKPTLIDGVVELIRHFDSTDNTDRDGGIDRKVLHDADMLAHMAVCKDRQGLDRDELESKIKKMFLTQSGVVLARQVLLETA